MSVCQIRGGLLLWASVFLCLSSTTLLAAPCGGVGNLSGVVFNDFNGDTVQGGARVERSGRLRRHQSKHPLSAGYQ